MKILLVQPQSNWGRRLPETPSRALLILGTLAQQRGHDVEILHADLLNGHITDELTLFKPDVVGITCNTFQVKHARLLTKEAKGFGAKVILGGPHASAWNDNTIDNKVIGEGENAFLELIGEKPLGSIAEIPVPNFDLVDLDRFCGIAPVGLTPSMAIMASRGCPFHCTFCNTPLFWGKQVRYRTPIDVVFEVNLLHHKYGINEVFFQDDTFNINHEWAFEIFERIIALHLNQEMLFKIACRVNEKLLTKEFLDLAYKAGVWNIFYGIESGSQKMLDRMGKGITLAEIKRAVQMTHKAGIKTQCSFIVGMPGETEQTLRETNALLNEIKPTSHGWSFACPFPNTELDKEVTAKGHKRDMDYADYGYGKVIVRTDELSYEDFEKFRGFSL